jgi:hypothetical protein
MNPTNYTSVTPTRIFDYNGWDLLLGIFSLRSLALDHSLGSFSFGSLVWDLWHSWLALLAWLAWLGWLGWLGWLD